MRPALPLSLALLLAACTPTNGPADPAPAATATSAATAGPATPAPAIDAATLAASHWRLTSAVDAAGNRIDALLHDPARPLQFDFADGRLSVSGGCNRMHGPYVLTGERFEAGNLAQTRRMCEEALMAVDAAIGARLAGAGSLAAGDGGTLVWTTAGGDRLEFTGVPTARTRYGGEGERVFLEVAAQRVPCHHPLMPDHRCLHVRELSFDAQGIRQGAGEWQRLYQDIEGYVHEPGVRNVLRLRRFEVADPPADGSSVAYVLDMVVESEVVDPRP